MSGIYYYIKERHNPQLKGPYFVCYGHMTIKEAKRYENDSLYGSNRMHRFKTEEAYEKEIQRLTDAGERVKIRNRWTNPLCQPKGGV